MKLAVAIGLALIVAIVVIVLLSSQGGSGHRKRLVGVLRSSCSSSSPPAGRGPRPGLGVQEEVRAQGQIVPGAASTAPASWAGAHTPEAKLHRRLGDAVGRGAGQRRRRPVLVRRPVTFEQEALGPRRALGRGRHPARVGQRVPAHGRGGRAAVGALGKARAATLVLAGASRRPAAAAQRCYAEPRVDERQAPRRGSGPSWNGPTHRHQLAGLTRQQPAAQRSGAACRRRCQLTPSGSGHDDRLRARCRRGGPREPPSRPTPDCWKPHERRLVHGCAAPC